MPSQSITNDRLPLDGLYFFVEKICAQHNLAPELRDLLLEQVERLGVLYGKTIPRQEALQVISQQIEVTRTGHVRSPVDIVEFIESPEYMNQGAYIRPAIMEAMIDLFVHNPQAYEVVLGGAIGIGKNYFADMANAYILYKMSCLYSPQAYYGLAPGSSIVFIHQSKTLILARKVVFNQFAGRLDESPYFKKFFPYATSHKAELQFPHNIQFLPVSGSDTAAIGMNVFGAVVDEMNFMQKIKRSRRTPDEEDYDQAEKLYSTIRRRMESRFMVQGRVPGKLFLISSANYKGDFISKKEDEAKHNETIWVMHMSQWEALPPDRFSGKKFFVLLPTDTAPGKVLGDERPENMDGVIEVPVEYKDSFERDLDASLRDLGGIAVARRSRFVPNEYIHDSFALYLELYEDQQIFSAKEVELTDYSSLEGILNMEFVKAMEVAGPFGVHIDLGLTNDSAGVAIGQVIGSKDIGVRTEYNDEKGEFEQVTEGELPMYGIMGLVKILPPRGDEIDINFIRDLIILLKRFIDIRWVTMDRYQSAAVLQAFRQKKIAADVLSVDKSPDPYKEFKIAYREHRVATVSHDTFIDEVRHLERDAITDKVDHPEGGSKDVADAVCGVIYGLSRKKRSYNVKGKPLTLEELSGHSPDQKKSQEKRRSNRPSSGRGRLYG